MLMRRGYAAQKGASDGRRNDVWFCFGRLYLLLWSGCAWVLLRSGGPQQVRGRRCITETAA